MVFKSVISVRWAIRSFALREALVLAALYGASFLPSHLHATSKRQLLKRAALVSVVTCSTLLASVALWRSTHISPRTVVTADYKENEHSVHIGVFGDSFFTDLVADRSDFFTGLRCISTGPQNCVTGEFPGDHEVSLFQRLKGKHEFKLTNFSRPAAYFLVRADLNYPPSVLRKLAGLPSFAEQVDGLLNQSELPNMLVIFLGHNDIAYSPAVYQDPNQYADQVVVEYKRNIERIKRRAELLNRQTTILIMYPVDWTKAEALESEISALHQENPNTFPQHMKVHGWSEQIMFYRAFKKRMDEWSANETNAAQAQWRVYFSQNLEKIDLTPADIAADGIHGNKVGWRKFSGALAAAIENSVLRWRDATVNRRPSP